MRGREGGFLRSGGLGTAAGGAHARRRPVPGDAGAPRRGPASEAARRRGRRAGAPLLLALCGAALGACASDGAMHATGRLDLMPGGRAEGRATVPKGATASLHLVNNGPGRVDFSLRREGGAEIAHGVLTGFTSDLGTANEPTPYLLVLEAGDDEAHVYGDLRVKGRDTAVEVVWTVTR